MSTLADKVLITPIVLGNPGSPAIANQPHIDLEDNVDIIRDFLTSMPGNYFDSDDDNFSGLTFAFFGGILRNENTMVTVANGTIALAASSTNYVYLFDTANNNTWTVQTNTSSYPEYSIPIWKVITDGSGITSLEDNRSPFLAYDIDHPRNGVAIPYGKLLKFDTNSSDASGIYKYETASDQEQLRIHISDNASSTDYLDIGIGAGNPVFNDGTWSSKIRLYTDGHIEAIGNIHYLGTDGTETQINLKRQNSGETGTVGWSNETVLTRKDIQSSGLNSRWFGFYDYREGNSASGMGAASYTGAALSVPIFVRGSTLSINGLKPPSEVNLAVWDVNSGSLIGVVPVNFPNLVTGNYTRSDSGGSINFPNDGTLFAAWAHHHDSIPNSSIVSFIDFISYATSNAPGEVTDTNVLVQLTVNSAISGSGAGHLVRVNGGSVPNGFDTTTFSVQANSTWEELIHAENTKGSSTVEVRARWSGSVLYLEFRLNIGGSGDSNNYRGGMIFLERALAAAM